MAVSLETIVSQTATGDVVNARLPGGEVRSGERQPGETREMTALRLGHETLNALLKIGDYSFGNQTYTLQPVENSLPLRRR